jgi:phosphomannomutase
MAVQNLQEWIALDKNQATFDYCKSLLTVHDSRDESASKEIDELFGEQIAFGTAGLRGKVGIGWTRMNTLTVQLATQVHTVHINYFIIFKGSLPLLREEWEGSR